MKCIAFARPLTAAAASLVLMSAAHAGIVYAENPDPGKGAGESLSTAAVTWAASPNDVAEIDGTLGASSATGNPYEVDLYKIFVADLGAFTASATGRLGSSDLALFLFDAAGFGVLANDDLTSLDPSLDLSGQKGAGLYYLAVALGGFSALDSTDNAIFNILDMVGANAAAVSGATTLASWDSGTTGSAFTPVSYAITLTGASVAEVPEPASWGLAGLGLLAAGLSSRRRQHRA